MLRLFSYVDAGARILRGVSAPEDWEDRARSAFLEATSSAPTLAAAARRGADPPAAGGVRAREGGLRAALRAQQLPGLGGDPGRRHPAAARLRGLAARRGELVARGPRAGCGGRRPAARVSRSGWSSPCGHLPRTWSSRGPGRGRAPRIRKRRCGSRGRPRHERSDVLDTVGVAVEARAVPVVEEVDAALTEHIGEHQAAVLGAGSYQARAPARSPGHGRRSPSGSARPSR